MDTRRRLSRFAGRLLLALSSGRAGKDHFVDLTELIEMAKTVNWQSHAREPACGREHQEGRISETQGAAAQAEG